MSYQIEHSPSQPNNNYFKPNFTSNNKPLNDLQVSFKREIKQKLKAPYKIKRLNYVIRNTLTDLATPNNNTSQQKTDGEITHHRCQTTAGEFRNKHIQQEEGNQESSKRQYLSQFDALLSTTRKSLIFDNIRKIYHKGSRKSQAEFQPQYETTNDFQNEFLQNYHEKRYNIATLSFLSRMISNHSLKQQFYDKYNEHNQNINQISDGQNLFNMEFNQLNEQQNSGQSNRDTQFYKHFQRTMISKPTNFLELNKRICCFTSDPQTRQNSLKIEKLHENLKKKPTIVKKSMYTLNQTKSNILKQIQTQLQDSKQVNNVSAIDRNMIIKYTQNIRVLNKNWMFTTKSQRNPYKPEIYTDTHAN